MHRHVGNPSSWVVRASVVGLLAVLCFLAGFSILTQRRVAQLSQRADDANRTSAIYADARFWVGQEESLERKYRLEPSRDVLLRFQQAGRSLDDDLGRLSSVDPAPANRAVVRRVLTLNASYIRASYAMFQAVDGHHTELALKLDHTVGDPAFGEMEAVVYSNAAVTSRAALARSAALRHRERAANQATGIAFGVGLCLLLVFALIIARFRRRLDSARVAEVRRLAELAVTDPLTELRNHRAFHEDLATTTHQVGRSGTPVSLVMLDLDGLKAVNDTFGHQAGDDCLRSLADAIRATCRGSDRGYRVGGDEFAVILDDTRTWGALEYVHRLQRALTTPHETTVSAGIAEALALTDKDTLIHEADLALITTKRSGHAAAIFTPDMEPNITTAGADDGHYTQTLANALARAVDAKDSYTRSHSQTVSQLAALIAAELNLDAERLARIRLAGLLHDVGKIGVPDAILTKPGKLTDDEYERMQAHSVLGYEIVSAADLPTEATWVRHHHERYDGRGYPDGLAGEAIPLESRIIFVADAFEAMTSDRPYRKAPGDEYALAELRLHAATQFDVQIVDALIRALAGSARAGTLDPTDAGPLSRRHRSARQAA